MKVMSALAAIPLAILLLTWLSLQSLDTNAEQFDRVLGEMDRFTMLEAALHRDVLNARVGMLRNYDPLVREVTGLEQSLARLHEATPVDAQAAILIEHLVTSLARQEDLVEQFKSNNALLQNSLAYFGVFTGFLGRSGTATGTVEATVSALSVAMLRLTLDTSPATVRDVQDRLDELARQTPALDEADPTRALLAHGRLLDNLLPATDRILKAFSVEPAYQDVQAFRAVIVARQAESRETARRFRLILYISSLILIGLLAQLGRKLRARARALYRRAALEHVIAQISMYLLAARPDEVGANIGRALGDLAACIEADRAYFLSSYTSSRTETWCRRGTDFPSGWPDRAPMLAAQLRPTAEGLVHVPCARRLEPGPVRGMFAEFGLQGWTYISATGDDGSSAALGFDVVRRPGRHSWSGELGLIRMALDTILNAIGRERLERERACLEARVQQAHRMETVGALASGVAHNFNNILGAIMGYAEMAEAEIAPNHPLASNLSEIRRAGERARVLVDQLLTFGRRREMRRRPVNMRELVSESMSLLRASLPASVEIVVGHLPDDVIIAGEHAQLQQVILNLCNNAAQAMDDGGRIVIDVIVHRLTSAKSLSHGELTPSRYVCLAVNDSGRGMSGPTLERIFEPFFTTRDAGNGLGLATVREIVREHRGAMHVLSSPNVGSRFETWLPCTIADEPTLGEALEAHSAGVGKAVLVVDDDREHLLRAEELLAALGYEPVGFTHPGNALRACRDEPSRFDLVLIGHCGPASSPFEIAAELHAILPGMPILLAAPSSAELATEALLAAGISDVLHLPLNASEVASAFERSQYASSARPRANTGSSEIF
jgi:signal transduction histidine kinase/ActR/RegA family two-component response regulator